MRRQLLTLLFCSILSTLCWGQSKETTIVDKHLQPIDQAILRCDYQYVHWEDSATRVVEARTLQIGNKVTRFDRTGDYLYDSICYTYNKQPIERNKVKEIRKEAGKEGSFTEWHVYDNYPTEGKVSIIEKCFMDAYLSVEDRGLPEWTLQADSTTEIMGYPCQRATTHFHDRDWVVWFTTEIPHPAGPWLLRGLPGLVVMAEDSEHQHRFLLASVSPTTQPILYKESDYFKTPRMQVLKIKRRFFANMGQFIQATAVGQHMSKLPPVKPKPYNPLRRIKE